MLGCFELPHVSLQGMVDPWPAVCVTLDVLLTCRDIVFVVVVAVNSCGFFRYVISPELWDTFEIYLTFILAPESGHWLPNGNWTHREGREKVGSSHGFCVVFGVPPGLSVLKEQLLCWGGKGGVL